MHLVFVYGTLMRGGCRAGALAAEQFVGTARTQPHYRLFDCGEYPALVDATGGRTIEGEVWRVSRSCLARLDEIEGVREGWYARQPVALRPPFEDQCVDAYFYLGDVSQLPEVGGRWVNR